MSIFDGLPDVFTGAFGQTVRIIPSYSSVRDIRAIFRTPSGGDLLDPGVVTAETEIHARAADLEGVVYNDRVVVNGVTYRAGAIMPDDKGMTRITLRDND
ncbi:MAG: hypothetical protein AAFP68_16390 [Pseudomonadota bacterium]